MKYFICSVVIIHPTNSTNNLYKYNMIKRLNIKNFYVYTFCFHNTDNCTKTITYCDYLNGRNTKLTSYETLTPSRFVLI